MLEVLGAKADGHRIRRFGAGNHEAERDDLQYDINRGRAFDIYDFPVLAGRVVGSLFVIL